MRKHIKTSSLVFSIVLTFGLLSAGVAMAWPPGGNGGGKPPKNPPPELPSFTIQSIGTLGGATSTAEGVNGFGDVVGVSEISDGTSEPYLYSTGGGMQSINTLTEGPLDLPARTLIGPDGRFYVLNTSGSLNSGSVAVFNSVTGEFIEEFISLGSNGLENPADMVFGPNGDLYIPSQGSPSLLRTRILRFNGSTGAYLDEFDVADDGGTGIAGLQFGTDVDNDGVSDLFVGSSQAKEVLVYSGSDRTFLGIFVTAGSGGLDGTGKIQFRDLVGDETPEMFVASRKSLAVLMYDGLDGTFLQEFVSPASLPADINRLADIQFGPDGDLYVTAKATTNTIDGTDDQAQVIHFDGQTGAFVEVFILPNTGPPNTAGWASAAPRLTFDALGDLYVNGSDTNQILRYEGPLSANPGTFIDIFIEGVGFILITARDVNNNGQIVGRGYPLGRRLLFGERSAYRYTPPAPGDLVGHVDDLGVPGLNFDEEATAINNDGDVAGHFVSADDGQSHAFLWSEETGVIDLGTLANDDTFVYGINDRVNGDVQVAGYAQTSNGDRAWLYDTATGVMQNLGLIKNRGGNLASRGFDLNNLGQVVGESSAGRGKNRAFLFSDGIGMQGLGTLGGDSAAFGVNDLWNVVGMADLDSGVSVGFVYTAETGMFELEPQITNLPGSLNGQIRPWRINNAGQIIGPAMEGESEAYILTPQ